MHISTSHCLVRSLLVGVVGRVVVGGGVVVGVVGPGHEGGLHHALHRWVGHELSGGIEGGIVGVDVDGIEVFLGLFASVEVVVVVDALTGIQVELDHWLSTEESLDVLVERILGQ